MNPDLHEQFSMNIIEYMLSRCPHARQVRKKRKVREDKKERESRLLRARRRRFDSTALS